MCEVASFKNFENSLTTKSYDKNVSGPFLSGTRCILPSDAMRNTDYRAYSSKMYAS